MEVGIAPSPPTIGESGPEIPPPRPDGAGSTSDFAAILQRLGERVDQGEALIARVERGGGNFDAAGLIALQAGIYRYSETVELAAKLVDRMGTAIKSTLQGQ
jgi:hypothetical protein